jgi:hypothetical protein
MFHHRGRGVVLAELSHLRGGDAAIPAIQDRQSKRVVAAAPVGHRVLPSYSMIRIEQGPKAFRNTYGRGRYRRNSFIAVFKQQCIVHGY